MEEKFDIVIKTYFGLEDVLMEELKSKNFPSATKLNRAVSFEGGWKELIRANYELHTALAVLINLQTVTINDEKDLYDAASFVNWSDWFDVDSTFIVKGFVDSNLFRHSQYPNLVIKDAIVDHFNQKFNRRPSIDKNYPDIVVDLHIANNKVTLSINSSGAPLFQRGYKRAIGKAPLNEVLAAGLILLSGWDKKSPFVDPMCGSGTIPIEAGLMANEIAPNIYRKKFAFQKMKAGETTAIEKEIRENLNYRPKRDLAPIIGSDQDPEMIKIAQSNMKNTSLARTVQFKIKDFKELEPPKGPGVMITNPPYGERLSEQDTEKLYNELGTTLKHQFKGYDCWVISSDLEAFKHIGLHASPKIKLFNGRLECRFNHYQIFEGSKKEFKAQEND